MQEQAKKSATFNMVVLVILIVAFLAGGYTVYKNLTAPPAIKSSPSTSTGKGSESIQGPGAITCEEPGTQLVQYDGKYMCGPICTGNQKLTMTGPTGATQLTCVCPSTGFITSEFCGGCIPENCATGYHICPSKGICACTISASGSCRTYIDDVDGSILAGSKVTDPECSATCVDAVNYLKTVDALKILPQMDEACKKADCFYDRQNPDSMVECSQPGSKFDGFNIDSGTCYKRINCNLRPDQRAISMYGPKTISNFSAECLTMKTTPNGFCLPLNTEDIKNKCLNDTDGCPIGYEIIQGTNACTKIDPTSSLPNNVPAGTPGCRPPGATRYWDGISCLGTVAYDLLLNIYQCQTTWGVLSTGKINAFTQFGAYIAVPSSRIMGVERFVFQIAGFECSMTTASKSIIVNGNRSAMTLNPISANKNVDFARFTQSGLNRNDYEFYNVQGIFGTLRTGSLFPTQDRATWNTGSTPQIPYRFTVGLLIQGADGKYVLNSLTEESRRSSSESDLIGQLQNVSMSQFIIRTPGGLPTPPTLNGDIAKQVFIQNTSDVSTTNKILSLTVASSTNTQNTLSVSAPIQNPISFVSQGEDQPYCIAGCLPDYCPGILDVTSPDNIRVSNQLVLFAINIDLANTAFPLNTNGTTKTISEKEESSYIYIVRTPLESTSTVPWSTLINQPGFYIVDNMNQKYKLSSIVSTGSGPDKHYVLSDYVEAGKNYRYDIGYYWGSSNYKTSLDEGKASSLRTFMVFAPPYTRDSCWAIPYNGNQNLPPHMIIGPGNSCVYPGFVNTTIGYGSNAPFDVNANIYSPTGPTRFSNINPKNVKLWSGSTYYGMTGVPVDIKISDVDINEAEARILNPPGDSLTWNATSPNWFTGITGSVKIIVEDGVVSDRDYTVGYSAEEYKNRLRDMDAFGRRNIPGYVPLNTDVQNFARGPTGILANPGFYDFDTNQFINGDAGKNVLAQGYTPHTNMDRDINTKVTSVLKATNASRFPSSTYYNYVSPLKDTVEQSGRKKVFSADYKYIATPSNQRPIDVSLQTSTNVKDIAYNQATGCLGKPLILCNRGTSLLSGKCSCQGTASEPGRCDTTSTERVKNTPITI